MEENTDQELIDLHLKGDQKAFNLLVKRYSKNIYNFAVKLNNKNNAEDIVQEIFIKVWQKIKSFDQNKSSFKTWLFTIARNTIIDFSRKKKFLLFSDFFQKDEDTLYENIPDEQILPDEALQKLQDFQILKEIIDKLKPKYKEVVILHYQEDLTFEEISKILKKPLNTVKSQNRRALEQIRNLLENAPNYQ